MNDIIDLEAMLGQTKGTNHRAASFALLCLGVTESLASGTLSATEGVRFFFHADNCLYVRKHIKKKPADEIMSRGVQLADLFDALTPDEAHREFQRELSSMRSLCLRLLGNRQAAA